MLLFACGGDGGTTTDGGSDASSGVDAAKDVNVGETSTSDASPSDAQAVEAGDAAASAIQTVFVIMMENHDWADIKGNKSAPYINGLAALGAHAEQYGTPPGNHPSEPNYIWLESGDNLGITDDNPPSDNHQSTPDHLVSQLDAAGISWKVYAEGISGTDCPSADIASTQFAIRHVPPAFFDDQTTNATTCKQHVRPSPSSRRI